MTAEAARTRAGTARRWFIVLGVLFALGWSSSSVRAPTASRARSTAPTAGTNAQNAILRSSPLIAAPLFFLVGLGALRLLVPLGGGQADAPRGPLGPRRARRGGTTSASTPITR